MKLFACETEKFVGTSTVDYGDHDAVPLIGGLLHSVLLN